MDPWILLLSSLACAGIGGSIALLVQRGRLLAEVAAARTNLELLEAARLRLEAEVKEGTRRSAELSAECRSLSEKKSALETLVASAGERLAREASLHQARLEELRREFEQREAKLREFVGKRDDEMTQRFKALSADSLKGASEVLLQLAAERFKTQHELGRSDLEKREAAVANLVKPISETLKRADEKLSSLQKEWTQDRSTLQAEIKALGNAGESLRLETLKLSRALSKPEVRGRYGEVQLRRVAELSGMVAYCDFAEQASQRDSEGRLLRPDMVVRLPNERLIAVDAKCSILAYIEAIDASTAEEREACLERFADNVAVQVAALSRKAYWSELEGSPEFVVMFVPGDQFVDAALSRRSDLLDRAAEQNVILASPSTLIGLLRAVAVGWREKRVEEQARELIALGRELHERAAVAFQYTAQLGEALELSSKRYNAFVASYESRLEPTLRKFEEAGVKSSKERPRLSPITVRLRELSAAAEPEVAEPEAAELDAPQLAAPSETLVLETESSAAPAPEAPLPDAPRPRAPSSAAEEHVRP